PQAVFRVRGRLEVVIGKVLHGVDVFNVRNPFNDLGVSQQNRDLSAEENAARHQQILSQFFSPRGFAALLLGERSLDLENALRALCKEAKDVLKSEPTPLWLSQENEADWARRVAEIYESSSGSLAVTTST